MRSAITSLSRLTRRLAAVAFGLWLGGAGCAFCCASVGADAAHARVAAAPTAALAEGNVFAPAHCPAHARASAAPAVGLTQADLSVQATSPTDNHASSCCGKSRQPSDAARKLRPAADGAANGASAELSHRDACVSVAARPAARGRSPDGRSAHVRCCVFLI